jgi:hypothetical protein
MSALTYNYQRWYSLDIIVQELALNVTLAAFTTGFFSKEMENKISTHELQNLVNTQHSNQIKQNTE